MSYASATASLEGGATAFLRFSASARQIRQALWSGAAGGYSTDIEELP